MNPISQHKVLVHGRTFEHCSDQVNTFFDVTTLVIYDNIELRKESSISSLDDIFWQKLEKAENKNRDILAGLINDLQINEIHTLQDVKKIEQGYVSKLFHILSHFIDGFIGIDSHFYNLLDDSHWVPEQTAEAIKLSPGEYWLIHIDCYADFPGEAGLLHM
jgi:hypothetical protein